MDMQFMITKVAAFFPIFLFSICFHEYAHGLMAKWKGDRTAELAGRLTLNPFAHGDLLGTVIFPIIGVLTGFFFGWAIPVPVNERNLKNPRADLFWIASAGPLSNIFLALVMALLVGFVERFFPAAATLNTIQQLGDTFIVTNLSLAVFNAIPLHPLDGGKIIARFISDSTDRWLQENQFMLFFILMAALQTPLANIIRVPITLFYGGLKILAHLVWGA